MVKISLRAYNREIEKMIDRGQIDEAIAHCRYILQQHPKYIGVYRLLGKAYLENQRYGDAADVLQRVLSAAPDDFVSHAGMSIIREDEGNLDAAIWHMERAFDVQPYNAAIREELSRLYGRRDGLEPPKIFNTRGSLARMYARGNLHTQAIAELRAALKEDLQRPDLQVLLARMYAQSGQRAEAVETCNALLKKLPNCQEANQILAEILPGVERATEAQSYRRRVIALDPYAAHTSPAAPIPEQASENAVVLERYEWTAGQAAPRPAAQPSWAASLGVQVQDLTPREEAFPEWLSAAPTTSQEEPLAPAAQAASDWQPPTDQKVEIPDWLAAEGKPAAAEQIPDWMKSAGWGIAAGEAKEGAAPPQFEAEEGEAPSGELARAEIPDWLRSLAPAEAIAAKKPAAPELLPWLAEIPAAPGEALPPKAEQPSLPDWLVGETPAAVAEMQPAEQEIPAWVAATPAEEAEMPDWLRALTGELPPIQAEPLEPEAGKAAPFEAEAPPWPAEALGEAAPEQAEPAEISAEGLPEWLAAPAVAEAAPSIAEAIPPESTPESTLEWLIPAIAVTPAIAETAPTEVPDWLTALAAEAAPPSPPAPLPPGFPAPLPPTSQPVLSLEDESAALAWLESLAAKQGALEEELLTRPEERTEMLPDWVSQITAAQAPELPRVDLESVPPAAEGIIPVADAVAAEVAPLEMGEAPPLWPAAEAEITEPPQAGEFAAGEELPDWLRGLATEAAVEETVAFAPPPPAAEIAPMISEAELPDWLRGLATEAAVEETVAFAPPPPAAEIAPMISEAGLPDWLRAFAEEPLAAEQAEISTAEPPAAVPAEPALIVGDTQPVRVKPKVGEAPPSPADILATEEEKARQIEQAIAAFALEAEAETLPVPPAEAPPAFFPEEQPALSLADEASAMAWLESLAAKQGALEEELLTRPEERTVTPPEWVSQAVAIETPREAAPPAEPVAAAAFELPEWLQEVVQPAEVEQAAPAEAVISETPEWLQEAEGVSLPEVEEIAAVIPEIIEWVPEEIPGAPFVFVEEQPTPQAEPFITPTEMAEAGRPPELPEWLRAPVEAEEYAWLPPALVEEIAMPAGKPPAAPVEEIAVFAVEPPAALAEEIAAPIPEPPAALPVERIDLNAASLRQMEQLPGVGFILAQNIVAYREAFGPFASLEELRSVSGVDEATLRDLKQRLILPVAREAPSPIAAGPWQTRLDQARHLFLAGDLDGSLKYYSSLIQDGQLLNEVTNDLRQAVNRHPRDFELHQTLGDAYVRNDRLQEALDIYTKAEDLLR